MSSDRYLRHSLIDWFSQDALRKSHIAVIGTGAIGNELVKNLVLLGVGAIDVFDFDAIESHNLTRSVLFRESDVGKNKVDVVAERARELDPNASVTPYHGDIWDTLTISMLMKYSAVVSCVDNFEARIRLNSMCLLLGKNLVNTGIDSRYASIEVFPFADDNFGPCYECTLPDSVYERMAKRYSCGWLKRVSFIERRIPTTIVTASTAAALASSSVLRFGDKGDYSGAYQITVDTIKGTSSRFSLAKNAECAACSRVTKPVQVIYSRNIIEPELFGLDCLHAPDATIRLSDQIVTVTQCTNCDPPGIAGEQILFERASKHSSSLATCPRCNDASVRVEIRDEFTLEELVTRFRGRRIDSKYALVETAEKVFVLSLEDK